MVRWVVLGAAAWCLGCAGRGDELEEYVSGLQSLAGYNRTLAEYGGRLCAPATAAGARDVADVLARYRRDLARVGEPDDPPLRALHDGMLRALDEASRMVPEPAHPAFVPGAQKAVRHVQTQMAAAYDGLGRLWREGGRAAACPLAWPAAP